MIMHDDHDDDDAIATEFGPDGLRRDFGQYLAIHKIVEFSMRQCSSHTRHQTLEHYKMLRMYVRAVLSE